MMKLYMGVLAISLFCGCATGSYWMPNDKSNRFVGRDAEWVLANFGIPALDYIISKSLGFEFLFIGGKMQMKSEAICALHYRRTLMLGGVS